MVGFVYLKCWLSTKPHGFTSQETLILADRPTSYTFALYAVQFIQHAWFHSE